jgi:hypothetical protein
VSRGRNKKDSEHPGFATHVLALSKPLSMSRGRNKKDSEHPGFATHVLALSKPLSMSRGRVYDMRDEKVVLDS